MCVTMPSPRDSPAPSGERVAPGAIAAAGLVAAVAFTIVVQTLVERRIVAGGAVVTVLGYAAFWVPLAAAVIAWRRGRRLLRFRPVDVLLGVGVGLLARALATGVEFAVYGTSSPAVFPRMLPTGFADAALQVFALVIAPLVLAPVIEELFFRGVVIDAVRGRTALPGSTVIAVVSSAAIFALLHLLGVEHRAGRARRRPERVRARARHGDPRRHDRAPGRGGHRARGVQRHHRAAEPELRGATPPRCRRTA